MMTKAENTEALDYSVRDIHVDALIARADGRTVDTRILWAPSRPTLDAALDLTLALLAADGSVTVRL